MSYAASGEMFGLDITTLSDSQIRSIHINKLIEFISIDKRVENIICNKMLNNIKVDNLVLFGNLVSAAVIIQNFKNLHTAYLTVLENNNYCLASPNINGYHTSYRSDYIVWDWLDDLGRDNEFRRYAAGEISIVNDQNLDFDYLFSNDPDLARSIADKIITSGLGWQNFNAKNNFISTMPEEMMDEYMPRIPKKPIDIYLYTLSNKNTPEDIIVTALKLIGKRSSGIPTVNVVLNKQVLTRLAPIQRLNTLESLIYYSKGSGNIDFGDIKTSEEFKDLLFSSFLRYTSRAERLIKTFSYRYEEKKI